ncbi:MAG: glycosyltransferase family 25 protein [Pseudomonadota bacterium]
MHLCARKGMGYARSMTTPRCQFFVINLDRSPDRLAVQRDQFDRLGLTFTRVPAVDGKTLLPDLKGLNRRGYDFRHGKSIHPNELGCYLSHYRAIETFMASGADHGVILEDDAGLTDDAPAVLCALIDAAQAWDVVNLNGRHKGQPVRQRKLSTGHDLVCYLFRRTGSAGYLINRKAGAAYLEKLLPMKVPYDHEYDRAWVYGFRYRGVQPVIVEGMTGAESTIGYETAPPGSNVKKPKWRRGSVLLYRGWNELSRVLHYAVRGKFIPRG